MSDPKPIGGKGWLAIGVLLGIAISAAVSLSYSWWAFHTKIEAQKAMVRDVKETVSQVKESTTKVKDFIKKHRKEKEESKPNE